MEALSLVANVVAVCEAASKATKYLHRLASLKNVPEQLLQLLNELSDLVVVLSTIEETCKNLATLNTAPELLMQIERKVDEADKVIAVLNELIRQRLPPNHDNDSRLSKVSWKSWIRLQGRVQILSKKIRDQRHSIAMDLTLLTATQQSLILQDVKNITFDSSRLVSSLRSTTGQQIGTVTDAVQEAHDTGDTVSLSTQLLIKETSLLRTNGCKASCMCCCHTRSIASTPDVMSQITGTLFVGYFGLPFFNVCKCTETTCSRQSLALVSLNYYFPRWFAARMMTLQSSWTCLNDYRLTIKTPRLRSRTEHIFTYIESGNVSRVQALFAGGLASPFDVLEGNGYSLLHIAVLLGNAKMCRLLLDQGADYNYENKTGDTPLDEIWKRTLTKKHDSSTLSLREVFSSFLDSSDFFLKQSFSVVHRIVLGLVPLDLEQYLNITTSEINCRSSNGRTPLYWACASSKLSAVLTLLKYGADLWVVDNLNRNTLHAAANLTEELSFSMARALLEKSKAHSLSAQGQYAGNNPPKNYVNLMDKNGLSPLHMAICKYNTRMVQLLIDKNADINLGAPDGPTPLSSAIQFNHHAALKMLLDLDVNVHIMNAEQESVLHTAAQLGDLETLKIIANADFCDLNLEHRNIHNRTPLETFVTERSTSIQEDPSTHLECRIWFDKILHNAGKAVDHMREKDTRLVNNVGNTGADANDSSEDEFFDTN